MRSRHHLLPYFATHITNRNDHVWAFPNCPFLPGNLCPRNKERHRWPAVLGGSESLIHGNLHDEFVPPRAFCFTKRSWTHNPHFFSYCWSRTGTKLCPKKFPSSHEIYICQQHEWCMFVLNLVSARAKKWISSVGSNYSVHLPNSFHRGPPSFSPYFFCRIYVTRTAPTRHISTWASFLLLFQDL